MTGKENQERFQGKKQQPKKPQVEQPCPQLKLWGTVDIHKYEAAV